MSMENRCVVPQELGSCLDPEGRFQTAWEVACRAATYLVSDRPTDLNYSTKSSSTDLVTEMDKGSERIIVDTIRVLFPEDGILGEEGTNFSGSSGFRWIIDPLDGTVNYLFGIPHWGVSLAIEFNGQVESGVIALPAMQETYASVRGMGSWCVVSSKDSSDRQVTKLRVRPSSRLSNALVMTGFGYDSARRGRQAELVQEVISQIADIRRSGAAVVDLCWFAHGRSDAYFEYGLNVWDYAAGALIATEAGGLIGGLDSPDFSEFLVAATPHIFDDLRELLVSKNARHLFEY